MHKSIIALCVFCLAGEVLAQSSVLEEITVTAQKREESLQDVGIAITAFSGEQLEELGLEESVEIIAFTPGVSLAGDIGGQRALFNIRGVVQNDFTDHAEAPVAVYIDEGYLASTQAQTFGLFDVERVEVLKGPQGTLFGRNATGGLVHSITRKPTREVEGYANFTYGSFDQTRFEGAVGGPLGDIISGRVSVMYNHHDEILNNIYTGTDAQGRTGTPGGGEDGYNDDTFAIRGQLQFDFTEDVGLWVSANYADTTKSEGPYQGVGTVPVFDGQGRHIDTVYSRDVAAGCEALSSVDGSCQNLIFDHDTDGVRPVVGGDLFGYVDPDGSDDDTNKDFAFDDENKIESLGFAAKLTWDLGWADLTAISDYKEFERSVTLDSDQSPTPLALFQSEGDTDQFSQEIRLSGETDNTNWVTGFYYLSIETDTIVGLAYSANSPFLDTLADLVLNVPIGTPGNAFGAEDDNTIANLQTDSYSVFGQLDYQFNEQWSVTAGLRLIIEEKEYSQEIGGFVNTDDRTVDTATQFLTFDAPFNDSTSDTLWSGVIQVNYTPTEDLLLYAGVNRGVKAGSFNAKLFDGVVLAPADIPYKEEILLAYEVGFKATLFGGLARLNGSAYYYDYDDYQAFTWANNSGFVTNNDGEYKGFELELLSSPSDGWDFMAGVSYTDAEIEDLEFAPGLFRDVTPSFTPKWQASGLLRYAWPALSGNMAAQLSFSYQSSFFHNMRNFTAHRFDGFVVGNARLTWASEDDRWEGTFFIDNIADSRHQVIGFDVSSFGGYTQESFNKPRWFGATIGYNF